MQTLLREPAKSENKLHRPRVDRCMELRASTGLLTAVFVSLMVCLTSPQQAHAGFGRHGGGGGGSRGGGGGGHSGGSSHSFSGGSSRGFGRSTVSGAGVYGARSYRAPAWRGGSRFSSGGYVPRRSWGWGGGYGYPLYPRSWGYPVWGYGFGYVPTYPVAPPPVIVDGQPLAAEESYPSGPAVAVAVAGDVMSSASGPLLGAQLSVEGQTLGFVLGYTAAFPPIGGTNESDTLHLAVAHMTFALWSGERGRIRGEVGVHLAAAPLATFVAPGAGLSAAFGLVGPLGMEARVYANAWPYTQLDARAGLALSFGGLGLGAGIRALYLNDNGALGAANAGDTSDTFIGPYGTLAIAL